MNGYEEEFENTKRVIIIRKSNGNTGGSKQYNKPGQLKTAIVRPLETLGIV